MFSGIIEELLPIKKIFLENEEAKRFKLALSPSSSFIYAEDLKIGESIAINGVCQTILKIEKENVEFYASKETLSITNLDNLKQGDKVNVERAIIYGSRVNGHLVSGHVDCVSSVLEIRPQKTSTIFRIAIQKNNRKYFIHKGSITVNGISLTVYQVEENFFEVMIIPHTYENTNLSFLKVGDEVNLEYDFMAKYVENFYKQ